MSSNFNSGAIFISSSPSAFRVNRAFLGVRSLPQVIESSLLIVHTFPRDLVLVQVGDQNYISENLLTQ